MISVIAPLRHMSKGVWRYCCPMHYMLSVSTSFVVIPAMIATRCTQSRHTASPALHSVHIPVPSPGNPRRLFLKVKEVGEVVRVVAEPV